MLFKYTLFSGTYYCKNIYSIGVSSHLIFIGNFAGRVNCFLGPNPLVCFSSNLSLYRSNSFRVSIKLFFNLHTSARLIALNKSRLKLTLSNASSESASHLATGHVSKSKGAIERSFGIFLGFHEHFTQR